MEFITDNYVWFIVGGVILVMIIIGYYAEKTDFGRKALEERVKEPKRKKEEKKAEIRAKKEKQRKEEEEKKQKGKKVNLNVRLNDAINQENIEGNPIEGDVVEEKNVVDDFNLDFNNPINDEEINSEQLINDELIDNNQEIIENHEMQTEYGAYDNEAPTNDTYELTPEVSEFNELPGEEQEVVSPVVEEPIAEDVDMPQLDTNTVPDIDIELPNLDELNKENDEKVVEDDDVWNF